MAWVDLGAVSPLEGEKLVPPGAAPGTYLTDAGDGTGNLVWAVLPAVPTFKPDYPVIRGAGTFSNLMMPTQRQPVTNVSIASAIYWVPLYFPTQWTVTTLAVAVGSTYTAGAAVGAALFDIQPTTGLPTTRLSYTSSSAISSASSVVSLPLTANRVYYQGSYWAAIYLSAAANLASVEATYLRPISTNSISSSYASLTGLPATFMSMTANAAIVSSSYTPPSNIASNYQYQSTGNCPILWVR